jgi:imidazolonepropionase-like amidohydrolase
VRRGGQAAIAALASATSGAAASLHLEQRLGRVAEGYMADVIAVAGDPSKEIEATQRVVFVMKSGQVVRLTHTLAGNHGK